MLSASSILLLWMLNIFLAPLFSERYSGGFVFGFQTKFGIEIKGIQRINFIGKYAANNRLIFYPASPIASER
jgi:hypothetical protein